MSGKVGSQFTKSGIVGKLEIGQVVQTLSADFRSEIATSTVGQHDDSIPQQSEGAEAGTLAYTPKSEVNILVIQCTVSGATSAQTQFIGALYQDSTANALSSGFARSTSQANAEHTLSWQHTMAAGTVLETTFKLRFAGGGQASTLNGPQTLGGTLGTGITITEYQR